MISLEIALYVFVSGSMFTLSVLGLESAIVSYSLDRWAKRLFAALFALLVLGSATFALEVVVYLQPSLKTVEAVAYFLQSVLYVIPFPMLAVYLLWCCGENWRKSLLLRIMLALGVVYVVLLVVALSTDVFYYIDLDRKWHYGPAYPLVVAPVLVILLLLVVGVLRRRDKLSYRYYLAFLACLLPVMIALLVHLVAPSFVVVNAGLTLSVFVMYRIVVTDSIEQGRRQQREIANQRARIAVLQMRPHFIYNTMTSIYLLCDQDPQLAKRVTMDFSTYLRRIFTAIASDDVISFSEELEHTRAYLSVEQAQFEDDLSVEYDTPHTQFHLPPLTLQPIVENAVKHGMDLDAGSLHIWIQTRETDFGNQIVVEDDGSGFDPAVADEPHTTLANIRQRLDMMCGGTMEISSREGGGTVVKITIPKQG